jgi:hypothetical protein
MNITIDQVLAKVGSQAIQIDLLQAEVLRLQAQVKALTPNDSENKPLTKES